MVIIAKYDVLDLRYAEGGPAVLRHVDGTGFAYYPSGRKAICMTAHGHDGQGKTRRFGAVVHADLPRSPVVAVFDDWGRGYADGARGPADSQVPKILINERGVTVIDGAGRVTELPSGPRLPSSKPGGEVTLRINPCISLQHKLGRSKLDFAAEKVQHSVIIGELQGEEVAGMPVLRSVTLSGESTRQLEETTMALSGTCKTLKSFKADCTQRDTKVDLGFDTKNLRDVLDNLTMLTQKLQHPNLCPTDNTWSTELGLKKRIALTHGPCPGPVGRANWSITHVSGKLTAERIAMIKPTVETPKTVPAISQLRLPELIEECGARGVLLVVICLASYAWEQCSFAKLMAEKAQMEVLKRLRASASGDLLPVRFVEIELTEMSGFAAQYGIREVPYCLMFSDGRLVHSKRLPGMSMRGMLATRPTVLLVEADPAKQFRLERVLRRNGFMSDLAMDTVQALRLASQQQPYGALLFSSSGFRSEQLRSVMSAIRQRDGNAVVLAYDCVERSDEDPESRKHLVQECSHAFPRIPSYTGLGVVLSRFDQVKPRSRKAGVKDPKEEFIEQVFAALENNKGSTQAPATSPSQPVAAVES